MSWTTDLDEIVQLCKEMNVRVDTRHFHNFENSSFNVSDAVNITRQLPRPDFFRRASKLIARDPIRLEVDVRGETFKLSIRCINLLCKVILRAGIIQINIWSAVYCMAPINSAVKVKPGDFYPAHSNGIVIGCESPLPNISAMEFTIAIQIRKYRDVEMYKCRVDYNQIIKLINRFEVIHMNNPDILHIMTFVDRQPVLVLLDGMQLLYNANPKKAAGTPIIPIVCLCQYEKACAKPMCTYSHPKECNICKIYNSPAHVSHCHSTSQTALMDSMQYIYEVKETTHDPDVDQIRHARIDRNGKAMKKSRISMLVMGDDGEFTEDTDVPSKKSVNKPAVLDKELICKPINCSSAAVHAKQFLSDLFEGQSNADDDDSFLAKRRKVD